MTSISAPSEESPKPGATVPMSRTRKNSGMVSASTGTIWATRNMIRIVVRNRNLNRDSATAARKAIAAETTTTTPATSRLFRKYRPKPETPSALRKFSSVGAKVHGRGCAAVISPFGFSADSTIQYSGKTVSRASTIAVTFAPCLRTRLSRFTVPPRSGAGCGCTRR